MNEKINNKDMKNAFEKMGTLMQGARQAVRTCMKIKVKDRVVIVTDKRAKRVSNAIKAACLEITPSVQEFILEDYGMRPIKKLPREIAEAVKKSTAVFYTASQEKGEGNSLRKPIIKLATKKGRQAHMPDVTEQLMKQGMCVDYNFVKKISKKVYGIVKNAKKIKVFTKKGTFLKAEFNKKIRWIICDGDILSSPMRWSNLPDGEVFTCVKNINGIAIIDGSIGDYFGEKYGLLEKIPIFLTIKNGRVKKLECKNKKLQEELKKYMKQDKNADRIGEFALGTNMVLKKLTGNLLQDEKFPSVHIAIGHGYPEETGAKWKSKVHCDLIITKTTVIVDGKKIMEDGKYLI